MIDRGLLEDGDGYVSVTVLCKTHSGSKAPMTVESPELVAALAHYFKTLEAPPARTAYRQSQARAITKASLEIAEAVLYSLEITRPRRRKRQAGVGPR